MFSLSCIELINVDTILNYSELINEFYMKKTALLLGTSRQKGNTSDLVQAIVDKTGLTVYDLKDYNISPYDYEHNNIDDDFIPLIEKLLKFDHIVFASPVYWYSMSAQMKTFFDRLSDLLHVKKELGRKLRGKDSSILSTGASPVAERSFEETFINSFDYLDMNYKGMYYCYCDGSFSENEHKHTIDKFIKKL